MPKVRVSLTLEGDPNTVNEYVNMAMGDGIVVNVNFEDAGTNGHKPKAKRVTAFAAGDNIEITRPNANYNVVEGERGRVVAVKSAGKGRTLTVKWKDGSETNIAASLAKKVRKS